MEGSGTACDWPTAAPVALSPLESCTVPLAAMVRLLPIGRAPALAIVRVSARTVSPYHTRQRRLKQPMRLAAPKINSKAHVEGSGTVPLPLMLPTVFVSKPITW